MILSQIVTLINIQECEESEDACKPEIAELLAKCKAGLIDYQANVNTIDFVKFATDMKNEQEFLNGLNKQLKPWMDGAEVTANESLKKPGNFEEARDIESQCVKFAKEVRKANKLLGKIDEGKKLLARYQTTAEQQIEEQVGQSVIMNFLLISFFCKEIEIQEDRECSCQPCGANERSADKVKSFFCPFCQVIIVIDLCRWEEMTRSVEKDSLDFQPLTQFLKCYAIYFSS